MKLIPLTKPAEMQAAGIPWTTHAARWQHRQAEENGLAAAFIKIGKRVYVDPDRFHELARKRSAA